MEQNRAMLGWRRAAACGVKVPLIRDWWHSSHEAME